MKKKTILIVGIFALLAIVSQILYCQWVFRDNSNGVSSRDVVLVYGGYISRSAEGLALAKKEHLPIFISETFGGPKDVEQKFGPSNVVIAVDHFARTTDQNARNAVAFLKKGNYRKALLVTSWFHMPRALFLTRLYLMGSGISVEPYFYESIPKHFLLEPDFWSEIFRFWGSLLRAALALVGFEKPWFHS